MPEKRGNILKGWKEASWKKRVTMKADHRQNLTGVVFEIGHFYTTAKCRPVTSLGHQEGRRVFREGPKFLHHVQFFKLSQTHVSRGGGNFSRGAKPPWLRAWPNVLLTVSFVLEIYCEIEKCLVNRTCGLKMFSFSTWFANLSMKRDTGLKICPHLNLPQRLTARTWLTIFLYRC